MILNSKIMNTDFMSKVVFTFLGFILLSCNDNEPTEIFPCHGLPIKKQLPIATYALPLGGKYVKQLMTYKDYIIVVADVFGESFDEIIIYNTLSNTHQIIKNTNNYNENQYILMGSKIFFNSSNLLQATLTSVDINDTQITQIHKITSQDDAPFFDNLQQIDGTMYYTYNDTSNKLCNLYSFSLIDMSPKLITQLRLNLLQKIKINKSRDGSITYTQIYENYSTSFHYIVETYNILDLKSEYKITIAEAFSLPNYKVGFNNEIYFYSQNETVVYDLTTGDKVYQVNELVRPFEEKISYAKSTIYDPLTGKLLFDLAPYTIDGNKTIIHLFDHQLFVLLDNRARKLNLDTGCFESEIVLNLGERIMYENQPDMFYSYNENEINIYSRM